MELDGDEPPTLVDVIGQESKAEAEGQDHMIAQVQEMELTKVPLSLITGKGASCPSSSPSGDILHVNTPVLNFV